MSNEGFFRRWSRLKSHPDSAQGEPRGPDHAATSPPASRRAVAAGAGTSLQRADERQALDLPPVAQTSPHPPFSPPSPDAAPRTLPTIDDIAALGPDSDFSAFVSQGVDKAVQRLAMKKLFSDPHFSILDGLDVYIDDYNKADPISAAMLASLEHSKSVFARMLNDETGTKAVPGDAPGAGAGPSVPAADGTPDSPTAGRKPDDPASGSDPDDPAAGGKPGGPQSPDQNNNT
jgi:hypothetical protein